MTALPPDPHHDEIQSLVTRLLPERLQRLQRASGLEVVFGGSIRWDARGPRLVISRAAGAQGQGLEGLVIEPGRGLGGRVLRDGEPGRADVYEDDADITHDFDRVIVGEEELTSVVAVPVLVHGAVHAVLYGGARGASAVSLRAFRAATTVAAGLQRDIEQRLSGPGGEPAPPNPRAALADLARLIEETADETMRRRLSRIHSDLGGRRNLESVAGSPSPAALAPSLTPREIDVLRLVGEGASNLEAAAELGLSPETVKAYLRSTLRKLGVNNRTAAAHMAQQWGLLGR